VLYPSIFCDQLFSIINISPSWTFEDSEIKVFYFDILRLPKVLIICSLKPTVVIHVTLVCLSVSYILIIYFFAHI
jgi:hypothetical protein